MGAGAESEYRLGTPDPVLVLEFSVTTWCNYRCAYCVTPVRQHRHASFHAFDRHAVDAWLGAFGRVRHDFSLLVRGGEPFLDHEGFAPFFTGVGSMPRLRYLRIDTNGSWSPDRYDSVPLEIRARAQLNVSFHPTQIGAEAFKKRLARILDAGWQVGMINFVMEAGQVGEYAAIRDHFQREHGIYVNPNPDAFDPAWVSLVPSVRDAGRRKLEGLLHPIDLLRKTGAPTAGKPCFYPSIATFIAPDGVAERACGVLAPGDPRRFDFIRESAALQPLTKRVRCPQRSCLCLDRYAFLDEVPGRGRALNLLAEYVRDCRSHQEAGGA